MRFGNTLRAVVIVLGTIATTSAWASHAFYVGKHLSADGGVLIGGTGEEVSSHWLEIVPAADHGPDETIQVGVTDAADMPGKLTRISQVAHTLRYLTMNYSDYEGFPASLTNGGINEASVAVRDVWAPSRAELVKMTPTPQTGPQYSDLARLVMERAHTARQGVTVIGDLIEQYGYSTYGGNTHLIADPDEAWVVWEFAGGQGLWAAERLGPDDVRMLYPGYIQDFPFDFQNDPNFMASANLVSFAQDKGWLTPAHGKTFNVFETYGDQAPAAKARTGGFKYMTQAELEDATRAMAPVTVADLIERVRDPRISDDEAGYGEVASLRHGVDRDMVQIWIAPTSSVAAPYIPWWLGVRRVPASFREHRYLTKDAGSTFLNPDFAGREATDFAGRRFKQVLYAMCQQPKVFLPVVTRVLQSFEAESRADMAWVEDSARTLIAQGKPGRARSLLTYYADSRAKAAMDLGETLVRGLNTYSRLVTGTPTPTDSQINNGPVATTTNCLVGADPDQPRNAQ